MHFSSSSGSERYVLWQDFIFDRETHDLIKISCQTRLFDVYNTVFYDDGFEEYGFTTIPIYDKDTGGIDYLAYYQTTVKYLFDGTESEKTVGDVPMTEQEAMQYYEEHRSPTLPCFEGISNVSGFIVTNSARYGRGSHNFDYNALNEVEKAIYDHTFELFDISEDKFYWINAATKRTESGIYTVFTYYDQKEWAGQSPVLGGLCGSYLIRYDETENRFETVVSMDKGKAILGFDDANLVYFHRGNVYSRSLSTESETKILYEPQAHNVSATATEDLLFLEYHYLAEESYEYRRVICTYDGTVLYDQITR